MPAVAVIGFMYAVHEGAKAHMRLKSFHQDVSGMSCFNCHLVSTNRLAWAKPRPHHASPAGIVVSPDGSKVWLALDDRDEVVQADVVTRKVKRTVKVSGAPFGLALDPAGTNLFVTCRGGDRVIALDTTTFREVGSIAVGAGPLGIAFCSTSVGSRLVVANSISDDISVLAAFPLQEISRVAAGREPYAVTATADGARALVANRMVGLSSLKSVPSSEVTIVDAVAARAIRRESLESAHLSEGICVVPSRAWALNPLVKVRNLVPITQVAHGWVMSSGLAITDLKHGGIIQMPLDEANDYFADPSGIIVDSHGKRAYIASGGADVVSVVDLDRVERWLETATPAARSDAIYDLSLSSEYVLGRIRTKRNPRQLALSPDGQTLFVAERLADSVLVVDTRSLRTLGRIQIGDEGLDDPIRRGERVFTSAAYTFQHQFSCRSCHPDGHVDGLSYDFDGDGIGDNLLDNRSLMGVAGTGPFKWNGKNPSLEVQCGPRFAKVLMRTDPFPPKALRDLTAFINSRPPSRGVQMTGGKLNPSQERGRAIFFATHTPEGKVIPRERRCDTCHRPPLYTVRTSFNVGTKGPSDTTKSFDTPHLLGIAASAPYLHDGRAQSLEELWTLYNTNDLHGVSSYMNKIQLNDLIEFLKTL
jgi:YVTN family beta-propeller protein